MAKIDIIIPYWGDFELLKEAVDSVLAQTESDWRLLIADDHYKSLKAKEAYSNHPDDRINFVRHPKNIGITNNFNYAIQSAKSDYCVIMGCDDKMLPNYIETALSNIGDADFYQPGVEVIDANSKVYLPIADRVKRGLKPKKPGLYDGEYLASSLSRGHWLYFPSITWKTKTLKKYHFDPIYKIAEDVALQFEMILDGAKMKLDNTTTFQYRRFSESLSSKEKTGVRFQEEALVYEHFAKKFLERGWKKASRIANKRHISKLHSLTSKLFG